MLCLPILSAMAQSDPQQIPWKTADYTLLAREMSLRDALSTFGTSQGMAVVMSKDIKGTLSGDFKQLTPQKFIEQVTALHNLIWYYDGSAIYVYNESEIIAMLMDLKYMKAKDVQNMLKELGMEDARYPLKTTSDDELLMVSGPPRYVQLVAELVEKADKLQEKRATSEVETRIFKLYNTWADDVSLPSSGSESAVQVKGIATLLEEIMQTNDAVQVNEHGLQNGDEQNRNNEADIFQANKNDKGVKAIITPENRLNAVIVRDVASKMPLYESLIKELDVPQKLVEIEVTSVEMSKNDALDWQLALSVKGSNRHVEGAAGQNASNLFAPDDLVGKGLSAAMSYVGKHTDVSASLSALRQKGKARSISRTTLLTMNNMAASMSDQQSYHARVVGSEIAALEEVSAGMKLDVKPRLVLSTVAGEPNQLWMTVSLEDGGFESLTVDSMPLTRSSSIKTQTAVFEGESIILAGYFRDIEEKAGWGIPYLRDIPFIGWLFGGIGKKKETVQRIFILTPFIIDLNTESLARIQASRQRDIEEAEQMEDDRDEDDAIAEKRQLDRKNQNEKRRIIHKDELKIHRDEIELEREKWDVAHAENVRRAEQDLQNRRDDWEKTKQSQEAEKN